MHYNNPWKKNVPQKVEKRLNMTVNLAQTQQWLQLTCIHCKCGAEPFTFSCSISDCHCHCVLSLGTCCHILTCFSPLTSAPPLEPNLRELEGWVGGMQQGLCRAGKESSPAHPPAEALLPAHLPSGTWALVGVTLFHCLHPSSADTPPEWRMSDPSELLL